MWPLDKVLPNENDDYLDGICNYRYNESNPFDEHLGEYKWRCYCRNSGYRVNAVTCEHDACKGLV